MRETISFAGADGERAIAYLYLPIHAARPVQVIHYVPGTGVELGAMALSNNMEAVVGGSVLGGRAMFGVALRGYQERRSAAAGQEPPATTAEFRDKIVNWVTDLRRGLDYLETRTDVDRDRIAFVAQSSGARTRDPARGRRVALPIRLLPWRGGEPGAGILGERHQPDRVRAAHQGTDDDAAGPARRGDPARDQRQTVACAVAQTGARPLRRRPHVAAGTDREGIERVARPDAGAGEAVAAPHCPCPPRPAQPGSSRIRYLLNDEQPPDARPVHARQLHLPQPLAAGAALPRADRGAGGLCLSFLLELWHFIAFALFDHAPPASRHGRQGPEKMSC